MIETWQILLGFGILALAANQIGQYFVRIRMPLISGFLFAGILVGPYVLGLISTEAIGQLRFIDEVSLAVIAFAAGSELYLKELQSRLRSIAWVTTGLVAATLLLGGATIFLLGSYIPFMKDLPPGGRLAVALLGGAILVARSPSSAIAIVNELRAKGPFTQTVLGVTVIMDVVVIVVFAVSSEIADVLLTQVSVNIWFLVLVAGELLLSMLMGYGLAKVMQAVMWMPMAATLKSILIMAAGFGIFHLSAFLRQWSHEYFEFEILLEPLLICMIGSFLVTNRSAYRDELYHLLHKVSPFIYIVFFTLTGASLALDILVHVWPVALALFAARLMGIFLGSVAGGTIAGEPWKQNRISWMAYLTQAGVGLGLAKEAAAEFPQIGTAFATMMIAVIVLNQLVGPPSFKFAIHHVGEAHVRAATPEFDGTRDVIIFGINARSIALARQLAGHDWQVKIATTAPPESDLDSKDLAIHQVEDWSLAELKKLDMERAESIVLLLNDDDHNFRICELAYEHFGIASMVVQLRNRENRTRFQKLGAHMVEPETAVVTLLEQFVRAPAGASLLLGMEQGYDIVDVQVRNRYLHNQALRDLKLPLEVMVLSIHRDGQALVTRGHTQIRLGDQVTMVGPHARLEEVVLRLEA